MQSGNRSTKFGHPALLPALAIAAGLVLAASTSESRPGPEALQGRLVKEAEHNRWNGEVVEDKDALSGLAVRVTPAKDKAGYTAVAWGITDLLPGEYDVVFRIKVGKVAADVPVARIDARNSGKGDPDWPDNYAYYECRDLKGGDFLKPGTYEELTVPLIRRDEKSVEAVVNWKGKCDLWVDRITFVPRKLFDDAEIMKLEEVSVPRFEQKPGSRRGMRLLVLAGLYHREYGVESALESLPQTWLTVLRAMHDRNGTRLTPPFPSEPDGVLPFDVVLMVNVGERFLSIKERVLLREYVRAGGGLLVCGGNLSLGKGGRVGTALQEMLPVEPENRWGLRGEGQPLEVRCVPGGFLEDLTPEKPPVVSWFHHVKARPGAKVLMRAGEHPILIAGTYGKGRVAVLAATPLGALAEGATHLFEWQDWPQVVRGTVLWLRGGTMARPVRPEKEKGK